MLHKGLPNSEMFISLTQDPNDNNQGAELTTGIRFNTESLLEWEGWTAPARKHIEQSGKYIDIHQFAEEYQIRVSQFHDWLESLLREHHAVDLENLAKLQEAYSTERNLSSSLDNQTATSSMVCIDNHDTLNEPFTFTSKKSSEIDEASNAFSLRVREIQLAEKTAETFPTQRPIYAELTDTDAIGTPQFFGPDVNGDNAIIFIITDGKAFGVHESDLVKTECIYEKILSEKWARDKISRKFIEERLFAWVRRKSLTNNKESFSEEIIKESLKNITTREVWAPIAHLEVEHPVNFGNVRIDPITSEKLDSLEQMGVAMAPAQEKDIRDLFTKMRKDFQGFAAIVVTLEAEPILAEERGLIVAQDAVGLLRFFSPAAAASWVLCPTALLGSEIIPRSKLLTLSNSSFSMTDSITARDVAFWRLSRHDIERLINMEFQQAASLINPTELSDFSITVRSSIITYSKGTTLPDPIDRLTHALSALEGVFLKHAIEPVESNIADRISFLLSQKASNRAEVAQNVRQVYWLREQYRASPLSPREHEILAIFIANAHMALRISLQNIYSFQSKAEFIEAVELLRSNSSHE
jgi:hypothetical protein